MDEGLRRNDAQLERAARLRRANEQEAWLTDPEAHGMTLRCECGHELCSDAIVVTPAEFDRARELRARLVSVAHEQIPGTGTLERDDRFVLVAEG